VWAGGLERGAAQTSEFAEQSSLRNLMVRFLPACVNFSFTGRPYLYFAGVADGFD